MQIINSALAFYINDHYYCHSHYNYHYVFVMRVFRGFFPVILCWCSWDSSVTTVSRLHDGRPRNHSLISSTDRRHFSSPKASRRDLVTTQSPIWPAPVALSPEYSCRSEADHLPSSSAKFKNEWSYTATSSYAFMACIATILALPLVFAVLHTRRHTFHFQLCYNLCIAIFVTGFFFH